MLNASAAISQDDTDTIDSRHFNLWEQDRIFDEAKQAFISWKISYKRGQELFKDLTAVSEVKDEGTTGT